MTDYDERVNDEADEHAQMMNERREGWKLKASEFNPISITPFGDTYEIKDDNNEINNQ